MSEKKIVTLDQIIDNAPRDLEVPGVGTVVIQDLTEGQKREAIKQAMNHPNWKNMTDIEKTAEIQRRQALMMLVDPKITEKDYLKSRDIVISAILDTISMDAFLKAKELADKRKGLIQSFLRAVKVREV